MEGKIGGLSTARIIDTAFVTVDFMPPEILAPKAQSTLHKKEVDVFSFGCVMLHAASHQRPTPLPPMITDPVSVETETQSEVERRGSYFDSIDKGRLEVLIPLIKNCLSNNPRKRASVVAVCEQLESLVDKEISGDNEGLKFKAYLENRDNKSTEIKVQKIGPHPTLIGNHY